LIKAYILEVEAAFAILYWSRSNYSVNYNAWISRVEYYCCSQFIDGTEAAPSLGK